MNVIGNTCVNLLFGPNGCREKGLLPTVYLHIKSAFFKVINFLFIDSLNV